MDLQTFCWEEIHRSEPHPHPLLIPSPTSLTLKSVFEPLKEKICMMILNVLPPWGSIPISMNSQQMGLQKKEKKRKECPWPVGAELAVICSSFLLICWVVSCVKQTLIQPDDPQAAAADAAVKGSASSTTSVRGEGGSAPFVPLTQTKIFSR